MKNISTKKIISYLSLVTVIIFLDSLFFSGEKISIYFGMTLLLLFIFSPIYINIILFYFFLPFQNFFVINSSLSLIVIIQFVLLVKLLFNKVSVDKNIFLLTISLLAMQLISVLFFGASIISIFSFILILITILFLKNSIFSKSNNLKQYAMTAFVFGLFFSIILSSFILNKYYSRFLGLWTNPNIFGLQLIVGISFLLFISNLILPFIVKIPFFLVFSYSITLTKSRSSIFGFGILLLFFCFTYIHRKIKRNESIFTLGTVSFFIALLFLIPILFNIVFLPIIEERGIIAEEFDISAGRFTHLIQNLNIFIKNGNIGLYLFGTGIENSVSYLSNFSSNLLGTHNTFAEMLISAGLFGFFIWLILVFYFLKKESNDVYFLPTMFVIMFYTFTAHLNASLFIYYLLLLCYSYSKETSIGLESNIDFLHEKAITTKL